ncbi:hypothetical protein ANO14919_041690 [Xylariales sp. No.14919]|nr:hypothetical protein ANO14919_041690 [Xylariales sp. No.14919]
MSRYEDGYPSRGRAADYYTYSAGGAAAAAPPYPHTASPGHTTYDGQPQARLTYEPQGTYYPPRSPSAGLHASESHSRPRSLARPIESARDRTRGQSDSDDSVDGRIRSPIEKAKRFVDNTFTDSTTGIGVGVLGALVGGLAAREAVDLTSNREKQKGGHDGDDAEHKRNQLIGTVVGAAVGALGANAVEKRIEARRARDEIKQEKWERKWRRPDGDAEVLEKIDVVARPRSREAYSRGSRNKDDWDARNDYDHDRDRGGRRRSRRRSMEREIDPGARSWRDVEDWVLDDGDENRRRRSRDSYRH